MKRLFSETDTQKEVYMLKLISPAGSPEAVIAAVQSGADMIYMGYGVSHQEDRRDAFSPEELAQCLRYCRVRGCKAAVSLGELATDETMDTMLDRAVYAARMGADALVIQDIGLAAELRKILPDMPLWGSARMGVHNLDGALTAAALGFEHILLAPELTGEAIAHIAKNTPIETSVYVHGPLCVSYSGQCHMSAMGDSRQSDSCLNCAEPCREPFSLGGRMDDHPLSMAEFCLIEHLDELEKAGVTHAVIGGRSRRPEYVAFVTRLYARALREKALPTEDEYAQLRELFAPNGLTDDYFTGEKGPALLGVRQAPSRAQERAFAAIRKEYMNSELRRIPVSFYAVIEAGRPALFAVEDDAGHRAAYEGFEPTDLGRQGITPARVRELLFRTGGTPYNCVSAQCSIGPHLDYPDEAIDEARRELLSQITEQARQLPDIRVNERPEPPETADPWSVPKLIFQISREDQLCPELAAIKPDWLYAPAELLAAGPSRLEDFRREGTRIAAVLPPIVSDEEKPVLRELLATLRAMGITEAVTGSLGLVPLVLAAGMTIRGDMGLNLTNSRAMEKLRHAGFSSLTASFQLSARQIRALARTADTEMIVYGRVPVMITEHCLIRGSSGRCTCSSPASLSDPFGSVYPVEKLFGCRNVVYDRSKIFLADRPDVFAEAGLWAVRLLFTTESRRECVAVAGRYREQNTYSPNNTSRGLYPKGAL